MTRQVCQLQSAAGNTNSANTPVWIIEVGCGICNSRHKRNLINSSFAGGGGERARGEAFTQRVTSLARRSPERRAKLNEVRARMKE